MSTSSSCARRATNKLAALATSGLLLPEDFATHSGSPSTAYCAAKKLVLKKKQQQEKKQLVLKREQRGFDPRTSCGGRGGSNELQQTKANNLPKDADEHGTGRSGLLRNDDETHPINAIIPGGETGLKDIDDTVSHLDGVPGGETGLKDIDDMVSHLDGVPGGETGLKDIDDMVSHLMEKHKGEGHGDRGVDEIIAKLKSMGMESAEMMAAVKKAEHMRAAQDKAAAKDLNLEAQKKAEVVVSSCDLALEAIQNFSEAQVQDHSDEAGAISDELLWPITDNMNIMNDLVIGYQSTAMREKYRLQVDMTSILEIEFQSNTRWATQMMKERVE